MTKIALKLKTKQQGMVVWKLKSKWISAYHLRQSKEGVTAWIYILRYLVSEIPKGEFWWGLQIVGLSLGMSHG